MTNEEKYGASPEEWLRRWDAGETVWTVEMGGLGPAYEAPIQRIAAETLRYFIEKEVNKEWISAHRDESLERSRELAPYRSSVFIGAHIWLKSGVLKRLGGVSGNQVDDGIHIALQIYRHGPVGAFTHPSLEPERLIEWNGNAN